MRRLARVAGALVALSACSTASAQRGELIPPLNIVAEASDPTAGLEAELDARHDADVRAFLEAHHAGELERQAAERRWARAAARADRARRRRAPAPEVSTPATSDGELVYLGRFRTTCYQLTGTTASGLRAGPGRVAVDPRRIALGTALRIDGYGDAVAADTGGAIKGDRLDVWRASCAGYSNPTVDVWRR